MGQLRYFALTVSQGPWPEVDRHEFDCAVDAEQGGLRLAPAMAGVLVYQQWFDLETGACEEPDELMMIGSLPETLLFQEHHA